MEDIMKKLISEEENLTKRELNEFLWISFEGEEEGLTDEEKKAWEVIK